MGSLYERAHIIRYFLTAGKFQEFPIINGIIGMAGLDEGILSLCLYILFCI